jgi:hypothetical protein
MSSRYYHLFKNKTEYKMFTEFISFSVTNTSMLINIFIHLFNIYGIFNKNNKLTGL